VAPMPTTLAQPRVAADEPRRSRDVPGALIEALIVISCSDELSSSEYSLSARRGRRCPFEVFDDRRTRAPPSSIWVRENDDVEFDTLSTTIGSSTFTPAPTRMTAVAGVSAAFKIAKVSLRYRSANDVPASDCEDSTTSTLTPSRPYRCSRRSRRPRVPPVPRAHRVERRKPNRSASRVRTRHQSGPGRSPSAGVAPDFVAGGWQASLSKAVQAVGEGRVRSSAMKAELNQRRFS